MAERSLLYISKLDSEYAELEEKIENGDAPKITYEKICLRALALNTTKEKMFKGI